MVVVPPSSKDASSKTGVRMSVEHNLIGGNGSTSTAERSRHPFRPRF
jgi:hypothetical protein